MSVKEAEPRVVLTPEEFRRMARQFANRKGPLPRTEQFKLLADTLVPGWFEWHDWTNRAVSAMCRRRWSALSGCAGSCKTRNSSSFATLWWLMAPEESSVIFCSTTMKMLRKRAWPNVHGIYEAVKQNHGEFGNFVDSQTMWQYKHGDALHAIFCLAVLEGDTNKAAAQIQGIHTKRQMVIVDEAEEVPAAIWKVCYNLWRYPVDAGGEFVFVAIANARSRISQFGRFTEPDSGWNSVSPDVDEWDTKPQLDGKPALVVRFDFRRTPNITAGKQVTRHCPSKHTVESTLKALEARGALNDSEHWCMNLSFPPPEGLSKTVFSETLLENHNAYENHTFTGQSFKIIGTIDPAYGGGDRPAMRFAAVGEVAPGKIGIESMPPILLFTDATSNLPVRYQLLKQIREACNNVQYRGQKMVCQPENFGFDATGDGGLPDIAQQEWSPRIIRIQYGGAASEDPCSFEDQRPANEVYKNKRAEMYFRSRNAVESGQLKGLDKDTAAELCQLEYSELRPDGTSKLITIQDKVSYKKKYQRSPDLADSFVQLIEVARLRGFNLTPKGKTADSVEDVDKQSEAAQAVYDTADHAAPEEFVEEIA